METVSMQLIAAKGPPVNMTIVDLRTPAEYREGHIYGAVNVPYEKLKTGKIVFDSTKKLAFYCNKGFKSMAAASFYERLGYKTVDFTGGYMTYRRYMGKSI